MRPWFVGGACVAGACELLTGIGLRSFFASILLIVAIRCFTEPER